MRSLVYAVLSIGFLLCGVLWLAVGALMYGSAVTVCIILFLGFQIAGAGFFLAAVYAVAASPRPVNSALTLVLSEAAPPAQSLPVWCKCGRSPCVCNPIPQPQPLA